MGFGILDDHKLAHIPATVFLNDENVQNEEFIALKHGTGRNAHIILAPQPSNDPNDPLNWSNWKKDIFFVVLNFGSILNCATLGPLINSAFLILAQQFNRSLTDVVVISGYNLLVVGCTGPIYCALSRKYGKRPIFLWSGLMAVVGCAVGEAANSYRTLLAARIIQGFATCAFESLTFASVGDIYFVHERGFRISVINLLTAGGSALTSVIIGVITNNLGWHWLFHILQIFTSVQLIMMFLLCPETTYIRDHAYDIDQQDGEFESAGSNTPPDPNADLEKSRQSQTISAIPAKKTYLQSLAIFTGTYPSENLIKLVIAPFVTLLNPGALYTCVSSGILVAWYVGTLITVAAIYSGPPWQLNPAGFGDISAGPFIGALIGSIIIAFLSDPIAKWATKKNKGVYEPEFRLLLMPLGTVLVTGGFFGYGYAVQNGVSVYSCAVLFGVAMSGIIIASSSLMTYALDAYRDSSNEIFIMNMFFKNFMFYGLSYFVNNWIEDKGPVQVYDVFGGTSAFLCLLSLPCYIYGKRMRSWWARHNLLIKLGLSSSKVHI